MSDIAIWSLFRQGDKGAFCFIYDQYAQVLCNYGDKISQDRKLTEDCLHDLFIELWNHRQGLGSTDSIKYYLFKSLRRKIIKEKSKTSVHINTEQSLENYDFEIVFSFESELVALEISQEEKRRLTKVLNQLSPRQKEAIFLKFYDDLTYEEVASVMSLELKSTYNLISKAIVTLRKNVTRIPLQHLLSLLL